MSCKLLMDLVSNTTYKCSSPTNAECHSGVCNGTLGELLQTPILCKESLEIAIISLPIQRFSWCYYTLGADGNDTVDFENRLKCKRAVASYLRRNDLALPSGSWTFSSELERGRGMASSTADMVATIRCLDSIFSRQSGSEEIAELLRPIERSDSVFLSSYALYLSGLQRPVRILNSNTSFHAFYIDEGESVDTESTTPALISHYRDSFETYQQTLAEMLDAFDTGNLGAIAKCATRSAVLGQTVVPKRTLPALLDNQEALGADGIVVAHTGSLIGYLFAQKPNPTHAGALSAFFRKLGYQCRYEKAQF